MHSRAIFKHILCISTYFLIVFPVYGQVKNWGDVSQEELRKTVFSQDSSAAAVVLFKKGNLRVEDNLNYSLDEHVRIKILSKEGYDWGNIKINYNKEHSQDIENIKALTYTLTPAGHILEHKMDESSIYDKKIINGINQKSFTLPSLEPGCVLEYRYTFKIGDPSYIPTWFFDETIPVEWSELTAEFPSFLHFLKVFSGKEELYKNGFKEFHKTVNMTFKTHSNGIYAAAHGNKRRMRISFNGERFTWAMKDQEAIKDLPFMTTPNDYKAKIDFQLTEFSIPEKGIQEDIVKSWDNVIDRLLEDEFSPYLEAAKGYDQKLKSLKIYSLSYPERIKTIFQYVSDSYNWNHIYGIYPEKRPDEVMETKTGTGSEMNLLLTGLLRKADIEAYPVLVSTRDHGSVSKKFVLPNQFNHIVVYVPGDQDLLLDTITGDRPLHNLPISDLNGQGLLIKKPYVGNKRWINLVPLQKTIKVGSLFAEIGRDGYLSGRTSYKSTGYKAFKEREELKNKGEERFANENIFKGFKNANLIKINHNSFADLDSVFSYTAYFDSAKSVATQVSDSLIYLDSTPFMKWEENPLKQQKREYPVDFPYSTKEKFVMVLKIPEGYNLESYPQNFTTRIARKGGMFQRKTEIKDGQLIMHWTVELDRLRYSPQEYSRLRYFFDQVIHAHSEKIILKKDAV